MHSDTYYRVALSRVPQVGAKLFRALVNYFGSARAALDAGADELAAVDGIGPQTAAAFTGEAHYRSAEGILRFAEQYDVRILSYSDEDYPGRLRQFDHSAPVLYYRGEADLNAPRTLALVGTRRMSAAAARQVERLLDPLVDYAPLVISGLAYGVDACAHRAALARGLPTLGVMGSGMQHVYPHTHARLARDMVEAGGGILTEYPFWTKPEREHFPARNRIVAALADLTVVVESRAQGGSMITAGMAHDLGRKLGACPGPGGAEGTAGCNALIKSGRAHLIEGGRDVIDLLHWTGPAAGRQRRLFGDLEPEEHSVVDALRDRAEVELDELRRGLGIPPGRLASLLVGLELKEVVRGMPGGRYRLVG